MWIKISQMFKELLNTFVTADACIFIGIFYWFPTERMHSFILVPAVSWDWPTTVDLQRILMHEALECEQVLHETSCIFVLMWPELITESYKLLMSEAICSQELFITRICWLKHPLSHHMWVWKTSKHSNWLPTSTVINQSGTEGGQELAEAVTQSSFCKLALKSIYNMLI